MESFRAFRIYEEEGKVEARLESTDLDSLSPGDVVIRAVWSDVNYKDALAATGKGKILKRFPLIGGVDVFRQPGQQFHFNGIVLRMSGNVMISPHNETQKTVGIW